MNLKYVIVNIAFADLAPIVFREDIGHEIPVMSIQRERVDSAGFVSVRVDPDKPYLLKASAYGLSVGLGIKSKPERDSEILTRFFNCSQLP
jgi:hypothetical protein